MRLRLTVIVAGLCAAAPAAASSFVTLPAAAPGPSPSIVFLGEADMAAAPEAADEPQQPAAEVAGTMAVLPPDQQPIASGGQLPYYISPSILSYGEPAVENVKVAAIPDKARDARPRLSPMVIRGGIVGDAFDGAGTTAGAGEPQAPAQASAPTTPARTPRPQAPEREPAAPPPMISRPPSPGGLGVPQ